MPKGGSQPYKRGLREPGAALDAMKKGAPMFRINPADFKRAAQKQARKGRQRRRGSVRR